MSDWDDWLQEKLAKQCDSLPKAKPPEQKKPVERRAITSEELRKIKALQHVNPAWWCGDSRFIEQFRDANTDTTVTERQGWFIDVLYYKYRRQLKHDGPKPEGYLTH